MQLRPTIKPAAALAAALLFAAGARTAVAADGATLLRQAVSADDSVSYTGTVTTVIYGREAAASTVVRIDHRAPHAWRIWYVAPADAYGRLIVSNESITYQYEPAQGKVFVNRWSQLAPAIASYPNIERVLKNYSPETGASTTVADHVAQTLSLVSRHTGNLAARLWIDAKTKLVLRRETYRAGGSITSKTSFDNVRFVKDLPKDLFDLSVPQGMVLVAGASYAKATTNVSALLRGLPFDPVVPTYLPEGFILEKGSVETRDGVKTLQLVYGDGLRTFSLFENSTARLPAFEGVLPKAISIDGINGTTAYTGGQTLVSWVDARLSLTMVGDLTPKEFARIGASIKP